jgi:uncharacterized protein (DUF2336 family)
MTISEDTIEQAVRRYNREYDRYLKRAARVAERCRSEIVEGKAIGPLLRASLVDASTESVARVRWFAARLVDGPPWRFPWRPVDGQGHA